jgi:tripartite ATP-independent transporter DctP family solute receptor
MKKRLALVLVGVMMMTIFAGCGDNPTDTSVDTSENTSENQNSDTSEDVLNLIVAQNQTSLENPYAYGIIEFKETVEALSDGQIQVTLHHGTLGESESELIEKLQMGAASMVVASPGFMTAIGVPEVDMLSLLYLFKSFDHWETAMDGEFGEAMKNIILEKTSNDFRVMGYWSAGVRDFYGKAPITKPEDAQGMTIRTQTSGVVKDFWVEVGAVPTSIAWGELYQALQQGVVDSAENDYTNMMLKEHHKTPNGKYFSETDHDYTTRLYLIDGNFYNSLSDQQKAWVDEAAEAATAKEREITYEMKDESKAKIIEDGAIVTEKSEIDIEAFKAIAIPIQDKFATDNNMTDLLEMVRAAE